MNLKNIAVILTSGLLAFSCNQQNDSEQASQSESQEMSIFPKGEKIENDNFTGTAYLNMMVYADSINQNSVGNVTFKPGARTNWHLHPNGQIILALEGEGYYQEEGKAKEVLRSGDVIKCPPNVPHWHGASPDKTFVQTAISNGISGPAEWLEPVSDEEYNQ